MIKDLTKWSITKTLVLFALPMLLWNVIEQIYNIADTIIVWKYVWTNALWWVWAAFPVFFLLISIAIWLSVWASVIMSQLFWAWKLKEVKVSAYTALISALVLWAFCSILWLVLCWPILRLLNTPVEIFDYAYSYLKIIFMWSTLLFIYNTATATFNSLWDSKTPLIFLIFSALLNIWLDLFFVIKLDMWVPWAAWATVISRCVVSIAIVITLLLRLKKINTEPIEKIYDFSLLWTMTKIAIAIPTMINQSIVSVGMLATQWVINWFWSDIVAWFTAASKVDTLAMMPIMNLSSALATFVAQNLWWKRVDRAIKWFKSALIISIVFAIVMWFIIMIFGNYLIQAFLENGANETIIEFWKNYLMYVCFWYIFMWLLFNSWAVLRASGTMAPFLIWTISSIWIKVLVAYVFANSMGVSVIWRCTIIWWWIWWIISMWAYLKWNRQKKHIIDQVE